MRQIHVDEIKKAVEAAVMEANNRLPADVVKALRNSLNKESSPLGKRFLQIILENAKIAGKQCMPLCQDTGLVVVELTLGQDVALVGGELDQAINQGIRDGYERGYFRKSVVNDPFKRINTGDNTPAVVHVNIVPGDQLRLTVLPKGAGSENMGQLAMLKPSQGIEGVKDFIIKVVKEAGANPCPPIIVGVGVGGNMEKAALLAKQALLREVGSKNRDFEIAAWEDEILERVNALKIGPQGMGGDTTALAVHIETYPTHIASLPVAVNLGCHSTRRVTIEL